MKLPKNGQNKIKFELNPPSFMPLLSVTLIFPTVNKITDQCLDLFTEFTAP